jgi:hypothetical protein
VGSCLTLCMLVPSFVYTVMLCALMSFSIEGHALFARALAITDIFVVIPRPATISLAMLSGPFLWLACWHLVAVSTLAFSVSLSLRPGIFRAIPWQCLWPRNGVLFCRCACWHRVSMTSTAQVLEYIPSIPWQHHWPCTRACAGGCVLATCSNYHAGARSIDVLAIGKHSW